MFDFDSMLECKNGIYLLVVIVDNGKGSKVLKICRKSGIGGGTICLGEGTVGQSMLTWLDIPTVRREIVLMAATKEQAELAMNKLNEQLKLSRPNHGIAFRLSLAELYGSSSCNGAHARPNLGGSDKMSENQHKAIFIIVNRGEAETVIEAAESAGARGATIINARGAGAHETSRLFAMTVEPEKEIILIISDNSRCDSITTSVRSAISLDQPGRGILFTLDVDDTMGLY